MTTVGRTSDEFLPTPLQQRILDLLAGRALHTDELVREVGDPQGFFSGRGGFWELRHLGFVVHDARAGNYRPDAPPAGMHSLSSTVGRVRSRTSHMPEQCRDGDGRAARACPHVRLHAGGRTGAPHAMTVRRREP